MLHETDLHKSFNHMFCNEEAVSLDPNAALIIQEEVKQARFRDSNRCNEGKAESATGAMQRSGQAADREISNGRQGQKAGSKRSESYRQSRETHSGKPLGNVRRG